MQIKPLIITMGEPAGIGGELTLQAWKNRKVQNLPAFCAVDNVARLRELASNVPIVEISTPLEAVGVFDDALPVINIDLAAPVILRELNPANGRSVVQSIEIAVDFCLKGQAAGVVTNPIHKAALYDIGFEHPGHTEFVAHLCSQASGKAQTPVMMLTAKDLSVVPLTVHIPLKDVPKVVTEELLLEKAHIINQALKQDFSLAEPRIAVAGLNPHAGEGGKIGLEDAAVIAPAIQKLNSEGLKVTGPHPADTLFHEEARAKYDVAIGMYHDQALIPLKTLDFHGGVNVTLGLSVVRTSPDHGTALDIAGQSIANPQSLMNAIRLAAEITENRG